MKASIYETQLDPIYKLSLYDIVPLPDDISEELFNRYQKVMKDFEDMQDTLKMLGHNKGYW